MFSLLGKKFTNKRIILIFRFLIALLVVALILWIVLETLTTPNQLISLVGYFVFLFILLISSKYPTQVKYAPYFWEHKAQYQQTGSTAFIFIHKTHWVAIFNFVPTKLKSRYFQPIKSPNFFSARKNSHQNQH